MKISFDPAKNERNVLERQLDFSRVEQWDWTRSVIDEDTRKDYGERRFRAVGFIDERLFVLVFVPRNGDVHVISLRKANIREIKRHAEASKS